MKLQEETNPAATAAGSPSPAGSPDKEESKVQKKKDQICVPKIDKSKKEVKFYTSGGQFEIVGYSEKIGGPTSASVASDTYAGKLDLSLECKSLMTNDDKRLFLFDATENNFSDRLFELNKFEGYWEPKPPLFLPRKKISAVYFNNYLYFTGEFENLSV